MQWFSSKTNPAARYLPDVFSVEEQHFVYRLLSSAAVKTDNRATSTGAIVIDGKTAFVSSEQEAILETLRTIPDGLTVAQKMDALSFAIENHRGLKPNKAYKWIKGKKLNQATFDAWWHHVLPIDYHFQYEREQGSHFKPVPRSNSPHHIHGLFPVHKDAANRIYNFESKVMDGRLVKDLESMSLVSTFLIEPLRSDEANSWLAYMLKGKSRSELVH